MMRPAARAASVVSIQLVQQHKESVSPASKFLHPLRNYQIVRPPEGLDEPHHTTKQFHHLNSLHALMLVPMTRWAGQVWDEVCKSFDFAEAARKVGMLIDDN